MKLAKSILISILLLITETILLFVLMLGSDTMSQAIKNIFTSEPLFNLTISKILRTSRDCLSIAVFRLVFGNVIVNVVVWVAVAYSELRVHLWVVSLINSSILIILYLAMNSSAHSFDEFLEFRFLNGELNVWQGIFVCTIISPFIIINFSTGLKCLRLVVDAEVVNEIEINKK